MPIYEFHCEDCHRDSEVLVRSTDWTGTQCPHCGSTRLTKQFSVFASGSGSGAGEDACCSTSPRRSGGGCGCGCGCGH
ncbi:FmdB family zinc ribbon protein [Limisphaera sp. VF-2]|uniref:FmdB family zinc ribbon protein n=1 Tax=Limisphaera sp. VF-2 TaxID=3400418 RepID=UPI001764226A